MPSRRDQIEAAIDKHDKPIAKTTKGKGRNYLPTEQGAGMTAKGRAEYNRKNNANLKAPQKSGSRHDSFCARMQGVVNNAKGDAPRAKASLKRWGC
jgi:hypothetical protein